ncbi:MAG TPA: hypothetical protein VLJ38_23410 [Polyangiaceae bacterium]|nr:hypothetical protein [Polyangiaceae bacterium]
MPRPRLGRRTKVALKSIQRRLEAYYGLECTPDVTAFAAAAPTGEREQLLVRESPDTIELALIVPADLPRAGANDTWLQLVEGVSHFVYVAERVRTELPTTQLELELQAEIDKFVLLGLEPGKDHQSVRRLHEHLYEHGHFLDPRGSEAGERYRLANDLAARLSARLLGRHAHDARALLQRFYRAGQTDKIALATAA